MKSNLLKSKQRLWPLLVFSFLFSYQSFCQISVLKFPTNNQILQRDDKDEATILVDIEVASTQRGRFEFKIWQEDKIHFESALNLSGETEVKFSSKIKAGAYNYNVKLYIDGQEIRKADRVVAGDIYLFYGQSNAMGYNGIDSYMPSRNTFLRYHVMNNFEGNDGEWLVPSETSRWPGLGLFPLELERILIEKHKYPVGIVVTAVGGADLRTLNNRNASNPYDLSTSYGRMMTEVRKSGSVEQIKYLIFRQGESDATSYELSVAYPDQFKKFIDNIKSDFPGLEKIYNYQVNILTTVNTKAAFLREFQRNADDLSELITNVSSAGTIGYDGLHYSFGGYSQNSGELARILDKEIYGKEVSPDVYSPDMKMAYWENGKLVLEFNKDMQMKYPNDTTIYEKVWRMKDYIYIDGKNDVVKSGYGVKNKIYLEVTQKGTSVTYLPSYYGDPVDMSIFYRGPHITNSLGMRAFSFENVPIEKNPNIGPLSLSIDSGQKCVGAIDKVYFTNYEEDTETVFKAQLSDENGEFVSARIIGEGKTSPITVTIPQDAKEGTGYKIRLMADDRTNNLTTDSFAVNHKAWVRISTKTPEINEGEDANISLEFTGTPPYAFQLSDSSRHTTNQQGLELSIKPADNVSYVVASIKNICGVGISEGKAEITVIKIVLSDEPTDPNLIRVFPNPVTDYLMINVNTTARADFRLFDMKGRLISESGFNESLKVSTNGLAKGTYIYRIKCGKSVNSGKIIIQ